MEVQTVAELQDLGRSSDGAQGPAQVGYPDESEVEDAEMITVLPVAW